MQGSVLNKEKHSTKQKLVRHDSHLNGKRITILIYAKLAQDPSHSFSSLLFFILSLTSLSGQKLEGKLFTGYPSQHNSLSLGGKWSKLLGKCNLTASSSLYLFVKIVRKRRLPIFLKAFSCIKNQPISSIFNDIPKTLFVP